MRDTAEEPMDIETILYRKLQKRQAQLDRKLEEVRELATPVSEREFLAMIREELPDMTESNLREHVRKRYREASTNGAQVTRWDVYHSKIQLEANEECEEDEHWKWAVTTQDMRDRGETYILPSEVSLTPLPNFGEYDPEELYHLRDDMMTPIRPKLSRQPEWFDRPAPPSEHNQANIVKYARKFNPPQNAQEQMENSMEKKEKREFEMSKRALFRNYERHVEDTRAIKPKPDPFK